MRPMLARDAMTPNPITVAPDLPLYKALDVMRDNKVRHLVVCEPGEPMMGFLSLRDVQRHMSTTYETEAEKAGDRALMVVPVQEVMTTEPFMANEEAPLAELVERMAHGRHGAVPVMDHTGRALGVVSWVDLLLILHERLRESKDA
jgi:CBS domain-containing protein